MQETMIDCQRVNGQVYAKFDDVLAFLGECKSKCDSSVHPVFESLDEALRTTKTEAEKLT
jgi:hypothetical protein